MIERFGRLVDHLARADARALEMVRETGDGRTPLGEILTHVSLHGSHHRGQIARRVREIGGEPHDVDFVQFVREHPSDGAGR